MAARLATCLAVLTLLALGVAPAPADARACGSVSGWRVTATNVSCAFARSASRDYARQRRAPRGWRCVRRRSSVSCARGNSAFGAYRR